MNYEYIALEMNALDPETANLVPEDFAQRAKGGEHFKAVVSSYFDKRCGILIYSESLGINGVATLETVFVREEWRGLNIARELIEKFALKLKELGYSRVFCRTIGRVSEVVEKGRLLKNTGFYPISTDNRFVVFDGSGVNTELVNELMRFADKVNSYANPDNASGTYVKIVPNSERYDLLDFLNSHSKINTEEMNRCYSSTKTSAFYVDGRIVAAYVFRKIDSNRFFVYTFAVDRSDPELFDNLPTVKSMSCGDVLFGFHLGTMLGENPDVQYEIKIDSDGSNAGLMDYVKTILEDKLCYDWVLDVVNFSSLEEVEDAAII